MKTLVNELQGGFCTKCGHIVTSFDNLERCPACGESGLPSAWRDQVTVSVNWHELRVLVMWAENYGRQIQNEVVFAIAKRLERQHPERGALTFAGELKELRAHYPYTTTTDGDLNQDIQRLESEEEPG